MPPHGITRACLSCGRSFSVPAERLRHGRGKYCSVACHYAGPPPEQRTCPVCGKQFPVGKTKTQKYCCILCARRSPEFRTSAAASAKALWSDPAKREMLMEGIRRRSASEEWRSTPNFQKGEAHPRYKGNAQARREGSTQYAYKKWRTQIFRAANFTCRRCGKRGGLLHAHHIKPWAEFPELRYEPTNGEALCEPCHNAVHGVSRRLRHSRCALCGKDKSPGRAKHCHPCAAKLWQSARAA